MDYIVNIGTYTGAYAASTRNYEIVNVGYYAGYSSGSMFYNVNVGANAGAYQSGSQNTFIGHNSGKEHIKGLDNTFIGFESGSNSVDTEGYNTFIGYHAGSGQFGSRNVFIGYQAGRGQNGNRNVYIGPYVGYKTTGEYGNTSYDYNTFIKSSTLSSTTALNVNNSTLISPYYAGISNIKSNSDSTVAWDTTNVTKAQFLIVAPFDTSTYPYSKSVITLYANTVYAYTNNMSVYSDKRLKENIVPVEKSLDKIRKINVYEFSMKSDKNHEPRIGVIAQEIKDIIPQAVGIHPFTKYYYVNSDWIMFNLINAVKELDKYVQDFQNDLKSYITQLFDIKNKLEILETKMENIAHSQNIMQAKLKEIDKKLDKVESK